MRIRTQFYAVMVPKSLKSRVQTSIPTNSRCYNKTMKAVNLQDAKTHLSRYIDDVEKGEVVVLCRHNKPVAEIRCIETADQGTPEFGMYDGFGVSESFFEPLPDDILRGFEGL